MPFETESIPITFHVGKIPLRTDGALIVEVLKHGDVEIPEPIIIEMAKSLRSFWAAIGDVRIHHQYLTGAALSWLSFGDAEHAEALCSEAESLLPKDTAVEKGLSALVHSMAVAAQGKLAEAAEAIDRAERIFQEFGNEGVEALTVLARSQLRLLQGDAEGCAKALEILRAQPLAQAHPALDLTVLETLLEARIAMAAKTEVQQLHAEYERLRLLHPSTTRDLSIYRRLATCNVGCEDGLHREPAYRLALQAARRLLEMFADKEEQRRFYNCQAQWLIVLEQFLRNAGPEEAAPALPELLPSPEALEAEQREGSERKKQARLRSSAVWRRIGVALTAFNLAVALTIVIALRPVLADPRTAPQSRQLATACILVAVVMLLLAVVSILLWLVYYLLRLFTPSLRARSCIAISAINVAPWLIACALLLMAFWS